jgi:FMN-dependent NADH-azoreductase
VRDFLAFIGVEDVEFIYAEGLAISQEKKTTALEAANNSIALLAA